MNLPTRHGNNTMLAMDKLLSLLHQDVITQMREAMLEARGGAKVGGQDQDQDTKTRTRILRPGPGP